MSPYFRLYPEGSLKVSLLCPFKERALCRGEWCQGSNYLP